jgi:hypothetical protein
LALLSGLLLIGLKKSGWLVFPAFGLILAFRTFRKAQGEPWGARLGTLLLLGLGGVLLLGGINHLYLWAHTGNPFGVYLVGDQLAYSAFTFSDPLRFLGLVALAPYLASSPRTIHLPWSGAEWYWPEYNLFFSHFGYAFILILGLALWACLHRLWRRSAPLGPATGKTWIALALLAWAVIATHRYSYDGGFNTVARFVQFLVPALLALGLLPGLDRWLSVQPRSTGVRVALLVAALSLFVVSAGKAYRNDAYAPWPYVADLWEHPEQRRMVFINPNRTPSMLDRFAGSEDVIATDLTYQTWLHPLWGEDLTRKVLLIRWQGNHAVIPEGAQWAVADNMAGQIWGNGLNVRSASDLAKAQGWGMPTDRDMALYRQLIHDPHWRIILSNEFGNQCVFQRVLPADLGQGPDALRQTTAPSRPNPPGAAPGS